MLPSTCVNQLVISGESFTAVPGSYEVVAPPVTPVDHTLLIAVTCGVGGVLVLALVGVAVGWGLYCLLGRGAKGRKGRKGKRRRRRNGRRGNKICDESVEMRQLSEKRQVSRFFCCCGFRGRGAESGPPLVVDCCPPPPPPPPWMCMS